MSRQQERKYMFAYGSNLCISQMLARCPKAQPKKSMLLKGMKLVFRSVADVVPARKGVVAGGLWLITPDCEKALDRYEGVANRLYAKKYFLQMIDGVVHQVLYYKMNERGVMPPPESYLAVIAKGYKEFHIEQYLPLLNKAVDESWVHKAKTPYLRNRYVRKGKPTLARSDWYDEEYDDVEADMEPSFSEQPGMYSTRDADELNEALGILKTHRPDHIPEDEWNRAMADLLAAHWTEGATADDLISKCYGRNR